MVSAAQNVFLHQDLSFQLSSVGELRRFFISLAETVGFCTRVVFDESPHLPSIAT